MSIQALVNLEMSRRGSTLIELLIVTAIILILIAIALPNCLEAQIRARVAAEKADQRTVGTAMESYFLDWGMYPDDHDPDSLGSAHGLFQLPTPLKYLAEIPEDGFNSSGAGMNNPGDEAHWYEMASTGVSPAQARFLRPKINTFAVCSMGTEGNDKFTDNDSWPYTGLNGNPCPNRVGYLNYSPTNGTKSMGNIVQLGGSFGRVTTVWIGGK